MKLLLPALLFLLAACAVKPLEPERRDHVDQVAAASLLGNELTLENGTRPLLGGGGATLDASAWGVDASFRNTLREGVEARGRHFLAFDLDPKALAQLAGGREGRWKKTLGKVNQALLDDLFRAADRQGIRYFFLLTPAREHDRFPMEHGNFGAACDASANKAYVYYFFDFALWDVAARKKIYATTVDPSVTTALSFGDCSALKNLHDPAHELEEPMKKTITLLVDALFDKMGWKKPGNPL